MVAQATRLTELHQERDRELVLAHQAGDRTAFAEIVGAHYPILLNQAYRRLRDRAEAEDAVQETLIRAYRHLGSFGGDFRLGPWLGRILHNVCADQCHRRSNEVHLAEKLTLLRHPDAVDPAEQFPGDDAHSEVREALRALPESYREAFVLRELEELPYSEVAALTGVTEQNARARVHRARTALRRRLGSLGTGAAALLPWRWFHRTAVLLPRSIRNGKDALATQVGSNLATVAETGTSAGTGGTGSLVSTASQMATQIAASPATQAVLSSATPSKSALVIGVAATIASTTAAVIPGAIAPGASGRNPRAAQVITVGAPPAGNAIPTAATVPSPTTTAATTATTTPAPSGASGASQSAAAAAVTKVASAPASATATTGAQQPAPVAAPPVAKAPWWLSVAEGLQAQVSGHSPGSDPAPTATVTKTDPGTSSHDPAGTPPRSGGTSRQQAPTQQAPSQQAPTSMSRDGSGPAGTSTGDGAQAKSTDPASHAPGAGTGTIPASPGGCPWMVAFPGATPQQMALPPAGSFRPVGLAHTSAVQLSETGPTLMASTSTQLTDIAGGPTSAIHLLYGACLPSGGAPALIADVTYSSGGASSEVQLRGAFVQQLGSAANAAYLFRGVVVSLSGSSGLPQPLASATKFVADLRIAQPYNTAKLSLVFLSSSGTAGSGSATSPSGSSGSTGTGTGTGPGGTGSAPSNGTAPSTPGSGGVPTTGTTGSTAPTYSTYDPNPNVTATTSTPPSTTAAPSSANGGGGGSGAAGAPLTSSTIPGTSTTTNG
ncbi:MAG: sigma-70 family RNA polymerase sigma factor [Actinomycetota bacterium]|nr:sigma-70 family RNA polymerase sigma factor [Actinomycetota bacterium]